MGGVDMLHNGVFPESWGSEGQINCHEVLHECNCHFQICCQKNAFFPQKVTDQYILHLWIPQFT